MHDPTIRDNYVTKRTGEVKEMTEIIYCCQKCEAEINSDDTVCPNGHLIADVGKLVKVSIEAKVGISSTLALSLTKAEQNTFIQIWTWLKKNIRRLEISEFEIGFPSGIKVKFTRGDIVEKK
jgi:hypothetical protein